MIRRTLVLAALTTLGCGSGQKAGDDAPDGPTRPAPRYNTKIPKEIMTPDRVETRIGTLKFFDGAPSADTVQLCYDQLDFSRGVESFLNGIPATSLEGLRRGNVELGAKRSNQVVIFDDLMDSNPLFLTGNTDTVYASGFLDLEKDGPTVVEIPKGCGPGTVNDAFFRFVVDMGSPGPDRGKGGKYLILPPGWKGKTPKGYFVARSRSYVNWVILRGFLVDGKPDAASTMFRTKLKIYPYKKRKSPPKMVFINGSTKAYNTIHANDFAFYEELHTVLDREPVGLLEPQLRGLFASIGVRKGKPFAPDARLKKLLTEAAAVGNATARSIWIRPRDKSAYLYPNSYWYTGFVGGDYRWLSDKGRGGRNLDARTFFFYMATVNTPAMVLKLVGSGSQYALNNLDTNGKYLDGSKTYKLNLPANAPAKDFWSIVLYDTQTRSELQTDQPFPCKNNLRHPDMVKNADGSIDLYFGPKAPEGHEKNWIQTVPNKAWFLCLRLYGPLKPYFDKTWKPGEIELLD